MKKRLFSLFFLLCLNSAFVFAYDFSIDGKNYSYNEDEFKFYSYNKGVKEQLSPFEVAQLFPDYEIVLVSRFDKNKKIEIENRSFKFKKILLLNDLKYRTFHGFEVYPVSARMEFQGSTDIKSLISVYGKKNVRLKHKGGDEFEIIPKKSIH